MKSILEIINYFKSPFIKPKLKFYFGKTKIGVPYFLPRRSVKDPDRPGYLKFKTKIVGFDFCRLGWKTKWRDNDFRFEWAPIFSFVFFGYQMAIIVDAIHQEHYWPAWLFYQKNTDKNNNTEERVQKCIEEFPMKWTRSINGESENVDYYNFVLKEKYRPLTKSQVRDRKLHFLIYK